MLGDMVNTLERVFLLAAGRILCEAMLVKQVVMPAYGEYVNVVVIKAIHDAVFLRQAARPEAR